jgi:hypothetical protein
VVNLNIIAALPSITYVFLNPLKKGEEVAKEKLLDKWEEITLANK